MNWLEEAEFDEVEEIHQEDVERFKIKDLDSLNWALRKLAALNKKHQEEEQLAIMESKRIADWFAKQDESYQAGKNFFEGLVEQYANEQRATDPEWKGQKSPYGKVGFKKQQPKWEYSEDDALVNYLKGSEWEKDYTRTKVEPEKAKIKTSPIFKVVEGSLINSVTGEVIPGVTVTEREPLVTIKVEG